MQWWTGEDSNLRSPQGAADLQSAGFSHSPTRPVKIFRDTTASRSCDRIDRTAVRGTSQCRKGSCPETPALALLSRGIRPLLFAGKSRSLKLSWRRELNPRPSDYKSDALPTELRQHRSNLAKLS